MTIHRTRQGREPSGGAEAGRSIIQIGDIFVEYSGSPPDQAALDAHFAPPDAATTTLTPEDTERLLLAVPGITAATIARAKRDRGKPLP